MVRIIAVLFILAASLYADLYRDADKAYALARYEKAALDYERYYLQNPTSDLAINALYKSAKSYYFSASQKAGNKDKAHILIDKIMILQEPEDDYYYKAILLKVHMLMAGSEYKKAEQLYRSSIMYVGKNDRAQGNLICYELYRALNDSVMSNGCLDKIQRSNGMAALYAGVNNDSVSVAAVRPVLKPVIQAISEESGEYSIQVGAFSSKRNADGLKNAYSDLGRQVIVKESIRADKTLFLVWVGKFESKGDARTFAEAHIADKEPKFQVISVN